MTDVDVVDDPDIGEVIEIDPAFDRKWNLPIAAPSTRGTWPRGWELDALWEDSDFGLFQIHPLHTSSLRYGED